MERKISEELFNDIKKYIDDKYMLFQDVCLIDKCMSVEVEEFSNDFSIPAFIRNRKKLKKAELEIHLEKSFSEELNSIIETRNLKPSDVYKKANIDRKHFSKIKNNKDYQPSKITAIAFALAFELNMDETNEFIGKAGYTLTHSSKFDIIIEYCITNKIYDVLKVNDILFDFGENLIGN